MLVLKIYGLGWAIAMLLYVCFDKYHKEIVEEVAEAQKLNRYAASAVTYLSAAITMLLWPIILVVDGPRILARLIRGK